MSTVTLNLGTGIRYAQIGELQNTEESIPEVSPWRATLNKLITAANSPEVEPQLFMWAMTAGIIAAAFALAGILALI